MENTKTQENSSILTPERRTPGRIKITPRQTTPDEPGRSTFTRARLLKKRRRFHETIRRIAAISSRWPWLSDGVWFRWGRHYNPAYHKQGFWCRQPRDLAIMGYGASQN